MLCVPRTRLALVPGSRPRGERLLGRNDGGLFCQRRNTNTIGAYMRHALLLAPVALVLSLAAEGPATAGPRAGTITVCGTFGNPACYTAPVRRTATGAEFQLKSGRWFDCSRDCHDKLRRETVDFWDEQRNSAGR